MKNEWFQVDKEGLAKLIDERGKSMLLFELVQNAWDTQAKNVSVRLEKLPGRPLAELTVIDDDPEGFHDLTHAYTLFAESVKKGDPEKRGRFNLGEKLVLALCKHARVESTTGTVAFNQDGTMTRSRQKTERGSVFQATIRMSQVEYDEACKAMFDLIPPEGVTTLFNGEEILPFSSNMKVATFEATLPTLISNDDGMLTRTKRKTQVEVFKTHGDGPGWIYEMGIPVVESGDKYHVNVHQKVPLNMDRDNVPPAYLRKLRAEVLNATAKLLTPDDAKESWVTNALEDESVADEAVVATVEARFGKNRVIYDPKDREASENAMAKGFTVMHGGSLPAAAWDAVRRSGAAKPAGQVFPTPKPYSDDPSATVREELPRKDWTEGMHVVAGICQSAAKDLGVRSDLHVMFVRGGTGFVATWGSRGIEWNIDTLGTGYFDEWSANLPDILGTMIHEFAHEYATSHLDEKFHSACTRLGGILAARFYVR